MSFSVLLSLYSKESPSNLTKSLDSVFTQTLRADEVVLVEDGPLTPELYRVVGEFRVKYPELKTVTLEKNSGLGVALNEGLKHCSNEWIVRMDTDDICKPYRFERQWRFIENHQEYDLVGSWIDEFVEDIDHITAIRKVPETSVEIYDYCKGRCPVNHPTVMYKKSAVLSVGGYLTKYFPEDYFLWIRMLMNGAKFYNIQESLLYFRYSPETIKKRGGWKYAIGEIHIQKMIYDLGFISFPLFIKNSLVRFITRIMPLSLRMWVYSRLLREKINT